MPKKKASKVKKKLVPQQARSRESLRKLLRAAAEVLGQHGVDGTTIPRIAAHAGMTPGAIYRRFHDKDTLIQTMILEIMESQDERLRTALTPEKAGEISLQVFAQKFIHSVLLSYRANAGLLRAIRHFTQSRPQTPFYRKVLKLEFRTYLYLIDLFLIHRKEIKHPDPKTAVSFALMMLFSTLIELVLVDQDLKNWQQIIPRDEQSLNRELLRAFLNYLGVEQKKS